MVASSGRRVPSLWPCRVRGCASFGCHGTGLSWMIQKGNMPERTEAVVGIGLHSQRSPIPTSSLELHSFHLN